MARILNTFRLSQTQTTAIATMAQQQGTTRTQAVETLINAGLQALKSPNNVRLK